MEDKTFERSQNEDAQYERIRKEQLDFYNQLEGRHLSMDSRKAHLFDISEIRDTSAVISSKPTKKRKMKKSRSAVCLANQSKSKQFEVKYKAIQ